MKEKQSKRIEMTNRESSDKEEKAVGETIERAHTGRKTPLGVKKKIMEFRDHYFDMTLNEGNLLI